ncbi:MAG: 4-hydroxy-3-methylbut-2-enyl diphosphate reductase [Flavobacteriales bacterium]
MKKFDIPDKYTSNLIQRLKAHRKVQDPRKQDFSPTQLDLGNLEIILPRHFGFCYGVENAIEKSYKAITENPEKKVFLLSQMIHNPQVNHDLISMGMQFITDTEGHQLIPWEDITSNDIVIIPAFGTTLEIEQKLKEIGCEINRYNTTCPFVERVWKRSAEIGKDGYTIIIHGKHRHEETRATFSHSAEHAASLVIRDMHEAEKLASFILGDANAQTFLEVFGDRCSPGFDPSKDLSRIGVVNQTTMLASETQEISDYLKGIIQNKFGAAWQEHFADTRDTLCYATNDNQQATISARESGADLAIVIGGYNSSNTAQIASILSSAMPTYFVQDSGGIISPEHIRHFDYPLQKEQDSYDWIPSHKKLRMIITSGASCPDSVFESVVQRIISILATTRSAEDALHEMGVNLA